jgi:hypothetical protein
MEHMRSNKEGWMAYALAGETETGTPNEYHHE